MQNINKKRQIDLGLVERALFTLQVRLKVRYLHCGKGQGYSWGKVSSSNNRRMLG